jgi:PBSX family phage terminase large subunit
MAIELVALPYQSDFLQDDRHAILLHGGLGAAKSWGLCADLYVQCARYPGAQYALTNNDYRQLWNSTHKELKKFLEQIGCPHRYYKSDKLFVFPNQSTVTELTLDGDPKALKGPEWDAVWFDELDRTTLDHFDYLTDRARGKRRLNPDGSLFGGHRVRGACNPVSPGHYLATKFFVDPLPGHRGMMVTTYDNAVNLPPEYIRNLEAKYPPGSLQHRRWMLGEIVAMEGQIYDCFNSSHITDRDNISFALQAHGLDLGYRDPTVFLTAGVDHQGLLWVTHEYAASDRTIRENAQEFKVLGEIFVDHQANDRASYQELGIPTTLAHKEVQHGIDLVRTLFTKGQLKIHRRCKRLITALYNYHWKKNSEVEKPDHAFSDECDALRYLCCGILGYMGAQDDLSTIRAYCA